MQGLHTIFRLITTAELAPEHKNRISHRGQALRSILEALGRFFAR